MKKRILFVFLALVLVVSLVAFAACAKEEEVPPVEEEVWQWPERLLICATSTASAGYGALIAFLTPLSDDTGTEIRIVCESNTQLRHRWLKEGRFFFGGVVLGGRSMLEAQTGYATRDGGPWQLRTFYAQNRMESGFSVRGDSGIKTPYDIKPGVKLIWFPFMGPTAKNSLLALLAWAQVDEEDVVWVPASTGSAAPKLMMDGRGDTVFGMFPTSPSMYNLEAAPCGLGWIDLDAEADPEGAKRFFEVYSDLSFGKITVGVPSAIGVNSLCGPSAQGGTVDIDPELVYHFVKWMAENFDRYKDAHSWCQYMTVDNLMELAETSYVPLHDGAVRYFEEIGRWTPAHEARRQQNIDLITRYIETFQACIDTADEREITVDPTNEEWLELWENAKKQLPKLKLFIGIDLD